MFEQGVHDIRALYDESIKYVCEKIVGQHVESVLYVVCVFCVLCCVCMCVVYVLCSCDTVARYFVHGVMLLLHTMHFQHAQTQEKIFLVYRKFCLVKCYNFQLF